MSFEVWLALMNIKINSFCDTILVPDKNCFSTVQECVLDGEEFEWCRDQYISSPEISEIVKIRR